MAREKTFNLKAFVIAVLRRASYRTKARSEVLKASRIARNTYVCAACAGTFARKEVAVDHKSPIVPVTGWDSFDGFIMRLFCGIEGLQVLCKQCHGVKTQAENAERRANAKIQG